jgi:Uma2 family endonuclease
MAITPVEAPAEVPPLPQVELVETDGEPLESEWHRYAMNLLIDAVSYHLRQRDDFYVGGNMFIYFSEEQARNRDFRGPDFFFVEGTRREPMRPYWAVWLEGGRYPDVIIELLSPRTALVDRTTKKDVYEQVFHTAEYYCYDPITQQLEGWQLHCGHYQPLAPNAQGWLWCDRLQLWLGTWDGAYMTRQATWLRFYDAQGQVVPVFAEAAQQQAEAAQQQAEAAQQQAEATQQQAETERQRAETERQRAETERQRAETERQRAETERQRAETAETELAQLRARLVQLEGQSKA